MLQWHKSDIIEYGAASMHEPKVMELLSKLKKKALPLDHRCWTCLFFRGCRLYTNINTCFTISLKRPATGFPNNDNIHPQQPGSGIHVRTVDTNTLKHKQLTQCSLTSNTLQSEWKDLLDTEPDLLWWQSFHRLVINDLCRHFIILFKHFSL